MLFEIECENNKSNINHLKPFRFYLVREMSTDSKLTFTRMTHPHPSAYFKCDADSFLTPCLIDEHGRTLTRQNIGEPKYRALEKLYLKEGRLCSGGFILSRPLIDLLGNLAKTGVFSFRIVYDDEEHQDISLDFSSIDAGDFILEYNKSYTVISHPERTSETRAKRKRNGSSAVKSTLKSRCQSSVHRASRRLKRVNQVAASRMVQRQALSVTALYQSIVWNSLFLLRSLTPADRVLP